MNKKKALLLVLLLFGAVGAYAFTRKKEDTPTKNASEELPTLTPDTDFSRTIAEEISNGAQVVAISFEEVANQLEKEMGEANTSKRVLLHLLKELSEADFEQVVAHFGKRNYSPSSRTNFPTSYSGALQAHDLAFWLKNELPAQTYQELKQRFPKHLP